jgi:hypothetical protein
MGRVSEVTRMHSSKRSAGILLSALLAVGWVATAAEPPTGIDVVWAYAGTWKTDFEHFDTAHSKASHEVTNLRNECWKNGAYLACNQYVDGDSKILLVFTYNPKDKTYTSYQIPLDGSEPGRGKLLIDGNVWTFPWQTTEGDKTTWFRVVNTFTAPGRIEFRQEFSTDQTHWTLMGKGVETKVIGK